jgi:hypothetical protein
VVLAAWVFLLEAAAGGDFAWPAAAAEVEAAGRRRDEDARVTAAGSATRIRRPGWTRIPEEMPFQRRNWLSEIPKRSAMVTKVSPRRAT